MAAKWSGLSGGQRIALRLAVLALAIAAVGLPINTLLKYVLILALAVAVFAGAVRTDVARWIAAAALVALTVAAHILWPAPRIDEGFNVFLPGPNAEQTSGLPADVVRTLTAQFDTRYPPAARCNDRARGCWRPDRSPAADGFAMSADGLYDRGAFSRRVTGIDFSDPVDLRIGPINDLIYNWPDNASDVQRFTRDRKSLNLFHRFALTFPLVIAHRFPSDFVGGDLCWRGTVLWPDANARYETISHGEIACRTLRVEDAGKTLFAASILAQPPLAMSLRAPFGVQLRRAMEFGLSIAAVVLIGVLLVQVTWQRVLLPATLIGATVILATIVDWQFIGGFRPLDAGDDGFTHEGYARNIVRHLIAGDLVAALRGEEAIYYFAPALRYWRVLERMLFGDTFLGYFTIILLLPFLVFALARRFLPARWALGFTLIFVAVPIGTAFGSSLVDYVVWASRGFADPLGFALLFAGILLVVPARSMAPDTGRAFFGALLLAMATFCRPNFLLASGTMIAASLALAVAHRQTARAAMLLVGFATLAVSPIHNYVFGRSLIPFTNNVEHVDIFLMSPLDYLRAAGELVRLDFAGPHVRRGMTQIAAWLSGAHRISAAIPVHAAAVLILAYVAVLGRRFDPWLRIVAAATLLQHGIGLCYLNNARYNVGTWLLTALVATVWVQAEGLALIERLRPTTRATVAGLPGVRHAKAWLARLEVAFGLGEGERSPLPRSADKLGAGAKNHQVFMAD